MVRGGDVFADNRRLGSRRAATTILYRGLMEAVDPSPRSSSRMGCQWPRHMQTPTRQKFLEREHVVSL